MGKIAITIEIDQDRLHQYTDEYLATYWHIAQANPADHGDHTAGELVERIGREIIRRWLKNTPPAMWQHQGRDHYWAALCKFAKYQPGPGKPGTPEWHDGEWVPRAGDGTAEQPDRFNTVDIEDFNATDLEDE